MRAGVVTCRALMETGSTGIIGPYRLLEVIGRGGMGVVFRAEHTVTGELVALKTVVVSDPGLLSSIRREIHALRRVEHPGVVRIVDAGVEDGLPWYVMELLEGRTLRDHNIDRWRNHATVDADPTSRLPSASDADTRPSLRPDDPRGSKTDVIAAKLEVSSAVQISQVDELDVKTDALPPGWQAISSGSVRPASAFASAPVAASAPSPAPALGGEGFEQGGEEAGRRERKIMSSGLPASPPPCDPLAPAPPPAPASVSAPVSAAPGSALPSTKPAPGRPRPFQIAAGGALAETLRIFRAICGPLAHIHGLGLVHRDLKPENVFLREPAGQGGRRREAREEPVLFDFGLAVQFEAKGKDALQLQFGGKPMGSPSYMAPGQIRGDLVDARADLYALGCMLYEAVTGDVPFVGAGSGVVLSMHLYAAPAPPSEVVEGVSPELDALILRLLQKRPEDRLGYAEDVASALAALGAAGPSKGYGGDAGAQSSGAQSSRAQSYLYRPGLAGRGDALRQLYGLLKRLQDGKGGLALLGGESGIGKTRLAMEIATEAARLQMGVITGECVAVSAGEASEREEVRGAPLHPFRHFLVAVADRCRSIGPVAYDRLLGPRGKVLAPYEPSLAGLPGHEKYPDPPELPANAARFRLQNALARTLDAFVEDAPLLLVIDDLQWADASSMGVLTHLDAGYFDEHRLLILGTYRAEEATSALLALTRAPWATSIALGRLDARAVGRMVSDMLAMDRPPEPFISFLLDQSEGNPFFIAEYLHAAVEEGLLARDGAGAWRIRQPPGATGSGIAALPVPRSLRDLVVRRLSGLGAPARALARMAAVLGRDMEERVLVAAASVEELEAMEGLAELAARHVLEGAGPGRLRFVHDKLRGILYGDIPQQERRALHAAAARALEARFAGSPDLALSYPILAHHFATAGATGKALEYLERAGVQALATGASGEAQGFFARAIALDDARPALERAAPLRRARWERRLGEACYNLGNMGEAERRCAGALALLSGRPAPAAPAARAAASLWQLGRQLAHLAGFEVAVATSAEERERLAETARAAEQLSEVYLFQNDSTRAFVAALTATNAAAALGPSAALARGYGTLSVAFGYVPLPRVVAAYAARAERTAEATGDRRAAGVVAFLRGLTALNEGRCADATALLEKAERIADEVQDRRRQEECMALLGSAAFFAGRWPQALARYAELSAAARRSSNAQGQIWARSGRAQCLILLGDAEEAIEILSEDEDLLRQSGDRTQQITHGQVARAHMLRGDRAAALRSAERTLRLMRGNRPAAFHCLHGYVAASEVFLSEEEASAPAPVGARRELRRKAREACAGLRRYARLFPLGRPESLRLAGVAAWLDGHRDRARRIWAEGIEAAAQMELPHDEARGRYELGSRLGRRDPEGAQQLRRAAEIFGALELEHWRERAEKAP